MIILDDMIVCLHWESGTGCWVGYTVPLRWRCRLRMAAGCCLLSAVFCQGPKIVVFGEMYCKACSSLFFSKVLL